MADAPYTIRDATPEELHYVCDSFLKSFTRYARPGTAFRSSGRGRRHDERENTRGWTDASWGSLVFRGFRDLVKDERTRVRVLELVPGEVSSYAVWDANPGGCNLHWVQTKGPLRRNGLATALLRELPGNPYATLITPAGLGLLKAVRGDEAA